MCGRNPQHAQTLLKTKYILILWRGTFSPKTNREQRRLRPYAFLAKYGTLPSDPHVRPASKRYVTFQAVHSQNQAAGFVLDLACCARAGGMYPEAGHLFEKPLAICANSLGP